MKKYKLLLDTSDNKEIKIQINDTVFKTGVIKGGSQALLPFLEECLKKQGIGINDISEINVATGPGSFTGLRVGVTIASVLGWVLEVPVNGRHVDKDGPPEISYKPKP